MARGSNDKSENYPGIGRHNVLIVCTLHGGACAHRVLTTWLRRLFIRITSRYMSYIIWSQRHDAPDADNGTVPTCNPATWACVTDSTAWVSGG